MDYLWILYLWMMLLKSRERGSLKNNKGEVDVVVEVVEEVEVGDEEGDSRSDEEKMNAVNQRVSVNMALQYCPIKSDHPAKSSSMRHRRSTTRSSWVAILNNETIVQRLLPLLTHAFLPPAPNDPN